MNTPTHVLVGVLALPQQSRWGGAAAIAAGAILPDAPMFAFYAYQKLAGRGEAEIWGRLYFEPGWQLLFDTFNSFPLFAALLAVSWWCGWQWGMLFAGSALLHLLCDLPLHDDDAHRHFLPLSDFRFASPVSYWDPRRHGLWFAPAEAVLGLVACACLAWPDKPWPTRVVAGVSLPLFVLQTAAVIAFVRHYDASWADKIPSPPGQPAVAAAGTGSEGATSSSSTP